MAGFKLVFEENVVRKPYHLVFESGKDGKGRAASDGWQKKGEPADAIQIRVVADNALVIIALPNGHAWRAPDCVDAARRHGFEIADDGAQGMGDEAP